MVFARRFWRVNDSLLDHQNFKHLSFPILLLYRRLNRHYSDLNRVHIVHFCFDLYSDNGLIPFTVLTVLNGHGIKRSTVRFLTVLYDLYNL